MTKDELARMRNAATQPHAIDPTWLRLALREIDETRAALDGVCKLYEQARQRYDEASAELARMRSTAKDGF